VASLDSLGTMELVLSSLSPLSLVSQVDLQPLQCEDTVAQHICLFDFLTVCCRMTNIRLDTGMKLNALLLYQVILQQDGRGSAVVSAATASGSGKEARGPASPSKKVRSEDPATKGAEKATMSLSCVFEMRGSIFHGMQGENCVAYVPYLWNFNLSVRQSFSYIASD